MVGETLRHQTICLVISIRDLFGMVSEDVTSSKVVNVTNPTFGDQVGSRFFHHHHWWIFHEVGGLNHLHFFQLYGFVSTVLMLFFFAFVLDLTVLMLFFFPFFEGNLTCLHFFANIQKSPPAGVNYFSHTKR